MISLISFVSSHCFCPTALLTHERVMLTQNRWKLTLKTKFCLSHRCLGSLQTWPGDTPSGLKCLQLEGIQLLSTLPSPRAEKKILPSLSARTEALCREICRQKHSTESPVLGFCARQNKRHPMLFQSLKFKHHESVGEVKGSWPQGKGYLTFCNSKGSIPYSAQHSSTSLHCKVLWSPWSLLSETEEE